MRHHLHQLAASGFTIIYDVFSQAEIKKIIATIESADQSKETFRKTNDLFAIRRFLNEVPDVKTLVFNKQLKKVINQLFGSEYFIVKSIYFDKPEKSNWFVTWHQDLTIAVDKKVDIPEYGPWTTKLSNYSVQPPLNILKENFTIRIHLDDTDEKNGALKVLAGSHHGILRVDDLKLDAKHFSFCSLKAGDIMIMKPLLMHSSERTTNNNKRRVIHIEFAKTELPAVINWAEKEGIF